MIVTRWALGAVVAATTVVASADELQLFARLLKRQEPGSAAYNCHDNCGQAIIQGRSSADVCNDETFLADYKACLQCAGPDNQDMYAEIFPLPLFWQYYGTTLTKDASACGLSTEPLSGKQPDVGAAVPASSGSASSSQASSTEVTSTAEASSVESSTITETPTVTESSTSQVEETGTTTGEESTPAATESATESATEIGGGHTTASATESASATGASSVIATTSAPKGTGSGGGHNATATTSSSLVVVTNAANAFSGSHVGFYGVLALGALYAAAN
ncbi:hypothetical protein M426DRAFT_7451 [Hypoxylon sp. CI-4A]|nr:hypothetical protein M426DRAFT_7451 [Hypoxylon sp. CI-4A]